MLGIFLADDHEDAFLAVPLAFASTDHKAILANFFYRGLDLHKTTDIYSPITQIGRGSHQCYL